MLAREPRARLLVVGFGGVPARGSSGSRRARRRRPRRPRAPTRGEDGRELPQLAAFLDGLDGEADAYRAAARGLRDRVAFAGRLDHAELADLLPAAEAMAVTEHVPGGVRDGRRRGRRLRRAAGRRQPLRARRGRPHARRGRPASRRAPWLSFEVGADAVAQLADALSGWLAAPEDLRAATRAAMVEATRARYSWDGVARTRHRRRPGRAGRAARAVDGARHLRLACRPVRH